MNETDAQDAMLLIFLLAHFDKLPLGDRITATVLGPTELIRPTYGCPN